VEAYLTARSLVDHGHMAMDRSEAEFTNFSLGFVIEDAAGNVYSPTGILWTVVIIPFYVAGRLVAAVGPSAVGDLVTRLVAGLYDPLAWGLAAAFLFLVCSRMTGSRRKALAIVLVWVFGTQTWGVSTRWSYLCLISCELLGLVWFMVAANVRPSYRFLGAGLCVGSLVLTRTAELVLVPVFLFYVGARALREPPHSRLKLAVWFLGPVAGSFLVLMLINLHRYGLEQPFGYTTAVVPPMPRWTYVGLWGLLFSPGRSLFLFSPVLALSVWCLTRPKNEWRAECNLVALYAAAVVLSLAALRNWPGDWVDWGPRYAYPVVPMLMLPLAAVDLQGHAATRAFRRWLVAFGLLGALVQVPVLSLRTGYWIWPLQVAEGEKAGMSLVDYCTWPQLSPVFMGFRLLHWRVTHELTGGPDELRVTVWSCYAVYHQATVPWDPDLVRGGDLVSHVLFSIRHGKYADLRDHLVPITVLGRGAQLLGVALGLCCFRAVYRKSRSAPARPEAARASVGEDASEPETGIGSPGTEAAAVSPQQRGHWP
jgi:hypothetical protein